MSVTVSFEDIISKPVAGSYDMVQSLGIYCWQYEKSQKNALYFLPRLSFEQNKDYLERIYPEISDSEDELAGKGIFISIWKIARVYNKVSVKSPEEILSNDVHTLAAFKAWCTKAGLDNDSEQQIYVLEEERKFVQFKYTEKQNTAATIYYDWDEILSKQKIKGKKIA